MHHQLLLSFTSEELRDGFLTHLESATQHFVSSKSVDNTQFMNSLLVKLDRLESQSGDATEQHQQQKDTLLSTSILDSSG